MISKSMLVLGLMSGTSADGIDVALARISGAPPHLTAKLLGHTSSKFPPVIRKEVLRVAEQQPIPAGELSQLNFRLGQIFADAALVACRSFRVPLSRIALIGSHGQTIFHQGQHANFFGGSTASTLQIGEPAIIAARTGIMTVGDFRPADVALGGQGAPLVPYADYLLYRHPKLGRVSLNLGGIANVTVLPPAAKPQQVLAFDTGPANMLIDALVSHFTRGRKRFDRNAQLASKGRFIPELLDELMHDPYLKLPPPKSTGREYYGRVYVQKFLFKGRRHHAKPNDLIRAATIFTAVSVVDALNRFVFPKTKIHQLIVSGGGAHNPIILAQISAALPDMEVLPSSRLGIPTDAKEAFAFALLAYETFHGRRSSLPSATGARGPAILGKISYAPPR
ncbi:MAG TPA: anhydro-N-acetylmuramic acid kinase [Candidatus Acidoferrum sp.]|jgi:anhydro-N-acetylmuramic acid kinase|nr:anhydro-N-acetylmuramic acid kinase [Candidatus Acidoferrum sp.]